MQSNTTANEPKPPPETSQRKGFLRDRIAKRKHEQSMTGSKPVRTLQDDFEETVKENDEEPTDELSMLVKDDSNGKWNLL